MKTLSRLLTASALAISAVFTGSASAQSTLEFDGWLFGDQATEAIDYAREHNVPVAVMRTYRQTTCPRCAGASRTMAASRPTREMVRVVSYVGAGSDGLNGSGVSELMRGARGQVTDESGWIPDLYFLMPDGKVIGFVPFEEANQTTDEANTVLQIYEWLGGVPGTIARADADAERGRYEQALGRIEQVIDQGAQVSHLIEVQTNRVEDDAPMPDRPVTEFFPNLLEEKQAQYAALAMEQLAEARELFEGGDDRGAITILRTLTRGPESFESTAGAQALFEEIMEARQAQ